MRKINIPVGVSDFEDIRTNDNYYVDKTGLISNILKKHAEALVITRPRRFGKTMTMSMLDSFFDIRKDSKALFDGLEISKNTELCNVWMNQYPTVFISFKQVDGLNFKSAYDMLTSVISDLFKKHSYLLKNDELSEFDTDIFKRLLQGSATTTEVKRSLSFLMRLLEKHYHKKVILLIDEYDVPVAKANTKGYYNEMLDVMKGLMQSLKDNSSLCFAIITGCLKIA